MPTKKATKRSAKKQTAKSAVQGDLFASVASDNTTVEVTLRVPKGTPITLGGTSAPEPKPCLKEAIKLLASLNKEELRQTISSAQLKSQELINLTTTLHGCLYRLASIGGKVTSR